MEQIVRDFGLWISNTIVMILVALPVTILFAFVISKIPKVNNYCAELSILFVICWFFCAYMYLTY